MSKRAPVIATSSFKKIKTPELLLIALNDHLKLNDFKPVLGEPTWDPEYLVYNKAGIYSLDTRDVQLKECLITPAIQDLAYQLLTPEVEKWAGIPIVRSWGYGIREYTNSCRLAVHRDRKESHVLSCIVHVDDDSTEPWPLDFVDHKGEHHEVYMKVGDTLLYESLCPHGRVNPFNGVYYRNTYFHWKPENWDHSVMDGVTVKYASLEHAIKDMS